jgi:hypothetical protein
MWLNWPCENGLNCASSWPSSLIIHQAVDGRVSEVIRGTRHGRVIAETTHLFGFVMENSAYFPRKSFVDKHPNVNRSCRPANHPFTAAAKLSYNMLAVVSRCTF